MRRWFRKITDLSDLDETLTTPDEVVAQRARVLTRDSAIRGLIAHADDRYQSLDIRLTGMQEGLQSITEIARDLRAALERGSSNVAEGGGAISGGEAGALQERMNALQRYLGKVLEYEAQRDIAVSEWVEQKLAQTRRVLEQEATRVVEEIGEDVEAESIETAREVIERLDEQSRTIAYDLSVQEARIRLAVTEGQQGHAEILREQLRALDAIEADLTTELDARLAGLADLIGDRTTGAVNDAAERVGRQSAEAVTLGVKDLLAVIDRRFAWLEETIQERMSKLEEALGVRTTVIPEADAVEVP